MRYPWWFWFLIFGGAIITACLWGAEPKWMRWDGNDSEPYRDVHSRGATYPDVHEATHQLVATLMNTNGCYGKSVGVYVLKGRCLLINHPNLTLRQLADSIPASMKMRSVSYVTNPHWEQSHVGNILYEWCCYSNEWDWNHTDIGIEYASDFMGYSLVLLMLASQDKSCDSTVLRDFVTWQSHRTMQQVTAHGSVPKSLVALRSADDAKQLRKFIWSNLDGVVAEEILVPPKEIKRQVSAAEPVEICPSRQQTIGSIESFAPSYRNSW